MIDMKSGVITLLYGLKALQASGGIPFNYDVYVTGKAAHAGKSPETGLNAVLETAHQIINAESLARKEMLTTMNAGFVEGGQSAFIVAPSAHAEIESRIVIPEEQGRVESSIATLAKNTYVPGTTVRVTGSFHRPSLVRRPSSEQLEAAVLKATDLLDLKNEFSMSSAASDGNNLSGLGVPVMDGMGPVSGREHSHDECLVTKIYLNAQNCLPSRFWH